MFNALAVLVGGRSWEWLRELCRPLGLEAQLLTEDGAPLLPVERVPGAPADALPSVTVGPVDRQLRAAARSAVQTRRPQLAKANGADVLCSPIVLDGRARGVLAVTRLPRPASAGAISDGQLTAVCGWLAGAVERHLSSLPASPNNLSALHKVLQHVVHGGIDRDLVAVFADALALWHDVQVVGYIETAPGVFVRAASLAGDTTGDRPIVFPTQALPPKLRITRMPQADINGMEHAGPGDLLVTTLARGAGDGSWLLTLSGAIDSCDPQLLGNYVSALDMAVALAIAASRTRVALLLSHRLALSPAEGGAAFEAALDALRTALAATAATVAVESSGRRILYHAGAAPAANDDDRTKLVLRRVLAGGERATLTLSRADRPQFTPLERAMAGVAVELLADWVVKPGEELPDTATVFGRTIERLAGETLERGLAVTAVVVGTGDPAVDTAQAFVDELRGQIRQSDLVGVLQPGEVGVLLPDTSPTHAATVARRIGAGGGHRGSARTIGFATRVPGKGAADGILREARRNARRRRGGSPLQSAAS
jgi:hypothetical protein